MILFRLHKLGVPESAVQQLLRAVAQGEAEAAAAQASMPVPTEALPVSTAEEIQAQAATAAAQRNIIEAQETTPIEDDATDAGLPYFGYDLL